MFGEPFHVKLLFIADSLHENEIEKLKFLLEEKLKPAEIENSSVTDLFRILKQREIISFDNLTYLVKILEDINRKDLVSYLAKESTNKKDLGVCKNLLDVSLNRYSADVFETLKFSELRKLMDNNSPTVIRGPPGAGKTVMALHTVKQTNYSWFEINCSTLEDCIKTTCDLVQKLINKEDSFIKGTSKCDCVKFLKEVLNLLKGCTCENHVIIFDNVRQECEEVVQCIGNEAEKNHVKIIVTTISQIAFEKWSSLNVEGFTFDETYKFMMEDEYFKVFSKDDILTLAQFLSNLPLGLDCSRAFIKNRHFSIKKYLKMLKDKSLAVKIDNAAKKSLGLCHDSLLKSLQTVIEQAIEELQQASNMSHLLLALSVFKAEDIPLVVLKHMLLSNVTDEDGNYYLGELTETIKKYSLGKVEGLDDKRTITMHHVTHWVLSHLIDEKTKIKFQEQLLKCLVSIMHKDTRDSTNYIEMTKLVPHCIQVLNDCSSSSCKFENEFQKCILFDIIGYMYSQLGNPLLSKEYLERALSSLHRMLQDYSVCNDNPEELYDACIDVSVKHFKVDFIEDFVSKQVQTNDDLALLHSKYDGECIFTEKNQIPLDMYKKLCEKGLCVPIKILQMTLFLEVFISVYYSYGRTYFYIKQNCTENEEKCFKNHLDLSNSLCQRLRISFPKWPQIHTLLSERNGMLYFLLENDRDQKTTDEYINDIKAAKNRYRELAEDNNNYYQLGILKQSGGSSYHTASCCHQLIKCMTILFTLQADEDFIHKSEVEFQRLTICIKSILDYKCVSAFYINIGEYLLKMQNREEQALEYFKKAFEIERANSISGYITHLFYEATVGIYNCIQKKKNETDNDNAVSLVKDFQNRCIENPNNKYAKKAISWLLY